MRIQLHESFRAAWPRWSNYLKNEVADILKGLQEDFYFKPDPSKYLVEYDFEEHFWVCQGLDGWQGWKLIWLPMEVKRSILDPIEKLLIMAELEPLVPSCPRQAGQLHHHHEP